jgi:hypothetical protein
LTSPENKLPADEHKVGYRKPPVHTRFRKGQSGNPGGRPRGMTAGRATALALKEAYRPVTVREGEKVLTLPAIQAVLRSQVALAAKGNGSAQRALIETVQAIERELVAQSMAKEKAEAHKSRPSDFEIARRIAFLLSRASPESRQPQSGQPAPDLPKGEAAGPRNAGPGGSKAQ